jgi:uridine phosphorylase
MTYPQYRGKHIFKGFINPSEVGDPSGRSARLPKKCILTYQPWDMTYFKRKYGRSFRTIKFHRFRVLYSNKLAIAIIEGIGSPMAVSVLEKLISLGCREFVNIGVAGGLSGWGYFLCEKALRDEGTSHHYEKHGGFAYPDRKMTERLGRSMERLGLDFGKAPGWTIDAPYRETRREIRHYRKMGIATVDMEASALFVAAKYRGAKMAAAFAVSDVLNEKKWKTRFGHPDTKVMQYRLIDAAVDCFRRD